MEAEAHFVVPGPPVPWERAQRGRHGSFAAPRTRAYQESIAWAFAACAGAWDRTRRYSVRVEVTYADARRRDLDNQCKSILDGLNGRAWDDDSQVDEIHIRRMPPSRTEPGMSVRIRAL